MMTKTFLVYLAVGALTATAATGSKKVPHAARKVASVQTVMTLSAVIGDKITFFKIERSDAGYVISMRNTAGESYMHSLKKVDFDFVQQEFDKIPASGRLDGLCLRQRVDITNVLSGKPPLKKATCLGGRSINEPKFTRFIQLLITALN